MIEPVELRISSSADLHVARSRARAFAMTAGFSVLERLSIALAVTVLGAHLLESGAGGAIVLSVEEAPDPLGEHLCLSMKPSGLQAQRSLWEIVNPEVSASLLAALGMETTMHNGTPCFLHPLPVAVNMPSSPPGGSAGSPSEVDDLLIVAEQLRWQDQQIASLTEELDDTNRGVMALYDELEDRAQQLGRAQESQRRFMAHLTHEFRTPVSSILALAGILLSRYDGELTPEQERQVTLIRTSAADLAQLVDDLLEVTRAEAVIESLRLSVVEVGTVFRALRGLMRPLDTRAEVALVFEDPVGVPDLTTDERKLTYILRNLISNALKFTLQGEVRVSARTSADGSHVLFAVADTGIGIPPEAHSVIFEEYVQVENDTAAAASGTGLGLPLSKRLVELLGGTLSIQSALGKGSTFTAAIPVVAPDPAAAQHIERAGRE